MIPDAAEPLLRVLCSWFFAARGFKAERRFVFLSLTGGPDHPARRGCGPPGGGDAGSDRIHELLRSRGIGCPPAHARAGGTVTASPGPAARAAHTARADGTVARPGSRVSGPTAASRPPQHVDFPTAARDVAAWLDAGPDARPGARAGRDFTRIPTHSANSAGGDVRALSGSGRPLPDGVRTQHEARFGVPLTHVRVHDRPVAHALARRHLARAFTVGPDIVFGEGRYQPASPAGRSLLGHELTHVVQQTGRPGASPADAGHEDAAEAAARTAEAGAPVRGRQVPCVLPAAVGIQAAALSQAEIQQLLLPQLIERIAENERETRVVALSEEYRAELTREHTWLVQRHTELTRGSRSRHRR